MQLTAGATWATERAQTPGFSAYPGGPKPVGLSELFVPRRGAGPSGGSPTFLHLPDDVCLRSRLLDRLGG